MKYYISNNGDDTNSGTSPETPWRTITKVNSAMNDGTIKQGDYIYLKCGDVFDDARFIIGTSGIVIGAYGSGNKPNIRRDIYCSSSTSNFILQDLEVSHNGTRFAIHFREENLSNITIKNIDIHDCDIGIFLQRIDTYTIENCLVYDAMDNAFVVYGSSDYPIQNGLIKNCIADNCGEGFSIHRSDDGYNTGPNHTFENCFAKNINIEEAYDVVAGDNIKLINCRSYNVPKGIAVGWGATNILVDGYIGDESRSWGLYIGPSDGFTMQNSVIKNSATDAIRIYGLDEYGGDATNIKLINNQITDKATSTRPLLRIGYAGGPGENNITVQNNIFISEREGECISYTNNSTPENTNSIYQNNIWWQTSGNPDIFGFITGVGDIPFSWWQTEYPTEKFQEPDCNNPLGYEGYTICGNPQYGQDPMHRYQCQCSNGICEWIDLGYDPSCGEQPAPSQIPTWFLIVLGGIITVAGVIIYKIRR